MHSNFQLFHLHLRRQTLSHPNQTASEDPQHLRIPYNQRECIEEPSILFPSLRCDTIKLPAFSCHAHSTRAPQIVGECPVSSHTNLVRLDMTNLLAQTRVCGSVDRNGRANSITTYVKDESSSISTHVTL